MLLLPLVLPAAMLLVLFWLTQSLSADPCMPLQAAEEVMEPDAVLSDELLVVWAPTTPAAASADTRTKTLDFDIILMVPPCFM